MALIFLSALSGILARPAVPAQEPAASPLPRGYSLPVIDLAGDTGRQVVVDREPGQYLGHPTTVLLEDGKTIIAVYPKGHGRGAIVMKRSSDGGLTWSDRLPVPENWATSQETPTIHRVVGPDGKKRLILFSGLYPARMAVSEDDGRTWTPLAPLGEWGGIVVMGGVIGLRPAPGRTLAMFHDDGRFSREGGKAEAPPVFTLYKTFSEDGGLTWSFPEVVLESRDIHLCEPGLVRSPDGTELAALLRENSRTRNSYVIFSRDEGKSWSSPRELPAALTGDRHTAKYAPDGRLLVSFRDTAHESPTRGDWVAWVGTYEDIVEGREGQYRVRLMDNSKDADCAYPGVEVLPDGTFVLTTYGHWIEGAEPFIVSVRLKLEELDRLAAVRSDSNQKPEAGGVRHKVVTRGDPGQSYEVYLPAAYDPGEKWPGLFLFDPGGRGGIPVERFRPAAEKFGWILVGSNNSRNGPWEPIARACLAMWNDVKARFSIDPNRVYAGGFSGGSRVASIFPRVVNHVFSGIIGCGAGLSQPLKAADIGPAAYLGFVGLFDFNYSEMKRLEADLDEAGVLNRLLVSDAGHDWPDPDSCSEALGWMEVLAMKRGLRQKDEGSIGEVLAGEIEKAGELEKAGRIYWAADRLGAVRDLAAGLTEIAGLESRIEGLQKSREYTRFVRDERARDKREIEIRQNFARAVAAFEAGGATPGMVPGLLRELELTSLKSESTRGKTIEDRALASRLLFVLSVDTGSSAIRHYEANDMSRARIFLSLALDACEAGSGREATLYVNLACVEARLGNRKQAIEALGKAVDRGYADLQALLAEEDLLGLRGTPEFQAILEKIKK